MSGAFRQVKLCMNISHKYIVYVPAREGPEALVKRKSKVARRSVGSFKGVLKAFNAACRKKQELH